MFVTTSDNNPKLIISVKEMAEKKFENPCHRVSYISIEKY